MAIMLPFQGGNTGSIPVTRSRRKTPFFSGVFLNLRTEHLTA